jgi:spermidine/putrescine transport system permease protein
VSTGVANRVVRRSRPRRLPLVALAQLAPATSFVLAFMVAPLAVFLLYSLWRVSNYEIVSQWNLENYRRAFTDEVYRTALINTIRIAGMAAVVATVVAYGFAHAMRFHLRRWQEPLLFLVIVALFSGYLVRIFAWRTLLGDQGIVNETLQALGLTDEPLTFLLYNRTAAVIVLANFLIPLAILPIYGALQNIGDGEVQAARDLGCTAAGAFRRVTLPLAWRGLSAAFALTFIIASADYLTPRLVGGVSGTMIGQSIATTFLDSFNWPAGAAVAFVTLGCTLLIVTVVRVVGGWILR